jgi:hypothetical protein
MGVSYSRPGIAPVYTTLRWDTSANLRADIDAAFTAAGVASKAAVTNGWKYNFTSPQGLNCKVLVQDNGNRTGLYPNTWPCIDVMFMSADESKVGYRHPLGYGYTSVNYPDTSGTPGKYEMHAGPCQFFIAMQGLADGKGNSVAGGIPSVVKPVAGSACASANGPDDDVSQMFWSCGSPPLIGAYDFRWQRYCNSYFSYLRNNHLVVWDPAIPAPDPPAPLAVSGSAYGYSPFDGGLELYPLTHPVDVEWPFSQWERVVKYKSSGAGIAGGDPLLIDAFMGWEFQIEGQLWDALMATRDLDLGKRLTLVMDDVAGSPQKSTWQVWNHYVHSTGAGISLREFSDSGTYFCSLCLLVGKPFTAPPPGPAAPGEVFNFAY